MLGALYYPKGTKKEPIDFDSLFIPYIYKEIYLDGLYIDIFNTKKNMVVLDVGANIGIVTDYMRPFCKKIYSIEPSSEHFEALKKNKEYNEWENVELFKMAIADKDGEMDLNQNHNNRTCHSLTNVAGTSSTEKVKTMRLDTFFKKNNITKVDFMKFDVEGAEDMILRGDGFKNVADKISALEVEFHYPNWQDLVKYLIEMGYKARRYECSAVVLLFTR